MIVELLYASFLFSFGWIMCGLTRRAAPPEPDPAHWVPRKWFTELRDSIRWYSKSEPGSPDEFNAILAVEVALNRESPEDEPNG